MAPPKVLMILTSHRLDCFRLCMDMLLQGGSIRRFDCVALLLNGVVGRHRRYVEWLTAAHPGIPWDVIEGPRGKGWYISNLQNECVRRHPGGLYFKIDEDVFVSADWDERLAETYARYRENADLALVSATIPNNGLGAWILLGALPEVRKAFLELPKARWEADASGCVWFYPHLAAWLTREFLQLDAANARMRAVGAERWVEFRDRFSINCICYDYRHWTELGGVREHDEVDWGRWIREGRKLVVFDAHAVCHHYTFFNQQDWLDRTSLLEDIRRTNLPGTLPFGAGLLPKWRFAKQLPRIAARRLRRKG
jgi:hypothetical protein